MLRPVPCTPTNQLKLLGALVKHPTKIHHFLDLSVYFIVSVNNYHSTIRAYFLFLLTHFVFQYNLALFVKASSSLLNDDITPAAFWATNPNNHYSHNAVAGGTHFGFWYRLLEHPEGPSFTTTVCPRKVPLGTSYNNSGKFDVCVDGSTMRLIYHY